MRIRWRGVARAVAIVIVALIALRLVPDLLRAPEPPPVPADVGLPQAKAVPSAAVTSNRPATRARRPLRILQKSTPRRRPDESPKARREPDRSAPAATAVIATQTRHRRKRRHGKHSHSSSPTDKPAAAPKPSPAAEPSPEPVESTSPPAPEYVAPPAPEPSPAPDPEPPPPPPSTPGDGSEEFAPH